MGRLTHPIWCQREFSDDRRSLSAPSNRRFRLIRSVGGDLTKEVPVSPFDWYRNHRSGQLFHGRDLMRQST